MSNTPAEAAVNEAQDLAADQLDAGVETAAPTDFLAELRAKLPPEFADYVDEVQRRHTAAVMHHVDGVVQGIFSNPITLEHLAAQVLRSQLNALDHKARWSKERRPASVILERYLPGAMRIMQAENGNITVEHQNVEAGQARKADQGWVSADDILAQPGAQTTLGELLASYNATPNRFYYLTDDITLQTFREGITDVMRANAAKMLGTAEQPA